MQLTRDDIPLTASRELARQAEEKYEHRFVKAIVATYRAKNHGEVAEWQIDNLYAQFSLWKTNEEPFANESSTACCNAAAHEASEAIDTHIGDHGL